MSVLLVVFCFISIECSADHHTTVVNRDPDRVDKLIKQLGHPRYVLREQAQTELTQIGPPALDALSNALLSDDIEIAMRARYLLTAIKVKWVHDADPKHIRALMKNYDQKSDAQRKVIIARLAGHAQKPELSALGRIVRYEKSTPLSKLAGLAILEASMHQRGLETQRSFLKQQLEHSQRPAAQWVRHSLAHDRRIDLLIEEWKKTAANEQQLWQDTSDQTNHEIVQKTFFYLITLLEEAGRNSEVEPYLDRIVELQPDDEQSVRNLVQWLLEKRSPRVIENVGEKFSDLFSSDPLLLYALAYAKRSLGKSTAADQLVGKAQKINPTNAANHLVVAYKLQQQGWFDWSETEYKTVIQIDGLKSNVTQQAISVMSEMLHDQNQDKKAAAALEPLVILLKSDPRLKRQLMQQLNRNPASLYSRMHFFRACHHKKEGDAEKQKVELLQAISEDSSDADVLIALYRMPNQTSEEALQTKSRINNAIALFRKQIKKAPNSATALNQFAWLVGNTLGETDQQLAEEAIRNSHKSLKLRPESPGYLDTLGRCYYAKGDLENAIRYQNEAARLDPHSGLIRRQLELFKKTHKQNEETKSSS